MARRPEAALLTIDDTRTMGPHLQLVLSEHRTIRDAVVMHDGALAAATMRGHLAGSRSRYAALIRAGGKDPA